MRHVIVVFLFLSSLRFAGDFSKNDLCNIDILKKLSDMTHSCDKKTSVFYSCRDALNELIVDYSNTDDIIQQIFSLPVYESYANEFKQSCLQLCMHKASLRNVLKENHKRIETTITETYGEIEVLPSLSIGDRLSDFDINKIVVISMMEYELTNDYKVQIDDSKFFNRAVIKTSKPDDTIYNVIKYSMQFQTKSECENLATNISTLIGLKYGNLFDKVDLDDSIVQYPNMKSEFWGKHKNFKISIECINNHVELEYLDKDLHTKR